MSEKQPNIIKENNVASKTEPETESGPESNDFHIGLYEKASENPNSRRRNAREKKIPRISAILRGSEK